MNTPRSCTMAEVAQALAVNRSTVSRALANHPSIPLATRTRIQAEAQAMGYRPNAAVSALMAYRRNARKVPQHATLAYVTRYAPRRGGSRYAHYFESLFAAAVARANQQGYNMEEFSLATPGMSARRLSGILRTRNIQGLIIAPLPESHARLDLDWADFSAVAIGVSLVHPVLHRSANNYFHSAVLALQRCRARGRRRPALALRARVDDRVEHRWLAAYQIEQASWPEADRVPALVARPWTYTRFKKWFLAHRPDAVLGTQTREIADWIRKLGGRVPTDVDVVSLDYQPSQDAGVGIDQNYALISATAVDFLIGMLHRGERGLPTHPITVLSEGGWVEQRRR